MHRRRVTLALVAAVLVVVTAACGGGGEDGLAFDGETVRSSDGVLTLEIPTGAAAEGVEIEVTRIADGDLPPKLQAADGVVVVGYELGPDGTQFSEPVALTFRVDASDHGLDLPEGAVPIGLLLTENAAGDLEGVGGEVSYEDGEVVVRAAVTHFTPAIFVFDDNRAALLEPREIELMVGGSRGVALIIRDLSTGETVDGFDLLRFGTAVWSTMSPFTGRFDDDGGTVSCSAPGSDGWVPDAYGVAVQSRAKGDPHLVDLETIFGEPLGIKLAGAGKCDDPTTATPAGSSGGSSPGESSGSSVSVGEDAVPSGPSSSDGSSSSSSGASSRSGPAVVIQPCLVIDQTRATSLMGTAVGPVGVSEEERDKSCGWDQSPDSDPTVSSGLFMTISRNSARGAGMLEAWRSFTPDATEVRSVPWTELGELRIEINKVGDEFATVTLFALAFSSDASSGDVYLMLVARGPVDAAESNAALLLTVAEELRDGVLAAQP